MKEEIVISIGGSILLPDDDNVSYIQELAEILKSFKEKYKLYLVVGGGSTARKYIKWGRSLDADEATLDELGISASKLNARLLIIAMGKDVYPIPADNFDEAISAGNHYSVITMGGTHPGHTTDAVAAMLAERLGSDKLINATSVDGVYTADPRKYKDAKKIPELDYDRLLEIVSKSEGGAGPNVVFDPLAAKIIKRANIETCIMDGRDLTSFQNAIKGKEFTGTKVTG